LHATQLVSWDKEIVSKPHVQSVMHCFSAPSNSRSTSKEYKRKSTPCGQSGGSTVSGHGERHGGTYRLIPGSKQWPKHRPVEIVATRVARRTSASHFRIHWCQAKSYVMCFYMTKTLSKKKNNPPSQDIRLLSRGRGIFFDFFFLNPITKQPPFVGQL
jgi:hypothetical protein